MLQREARIEGFLTEVGWQDAACAPLAGDASFRRYVRLTGDNGARAMLMDAPPPQEDVRPFVTIANRLLSMGLSAPQILATDIDVGLLLLEDFGDATYTQILRNDGDEAALYQLATETLIELHRRFFDLGDIPPYDDTRLLDEAVLLVDWFLPALQGVKHQMVCGKNIWVCGVMSWRWTAVCRQLWCCAITMLTISCTSPTAAAYPHVACSISRTQ